MHFVNRILKQVAVAAALVLAFSELGSAQDCGGCGHERYCDSHPEVCTPPVVPVRSFQLALWGYGSNTYGGETVADYAFFWSTDPQPAGVDSIMMLSHSADTDPATLDDSNRGANLGPLDWSHIVAVVADEPYSNGLNERFRERTTNPCYLPGSARFYATHDLEAQLHALADKVKSHSTATRFWINFSEPELNWMMDTACPMPLNQSYIDVISIDKYDVPFSQVQPFYDWMLAHPASNWQQLALLPGTFYSYSPTLENPIYPASLLPGFFDYAESLNQRCDTWLSQSPGSLPITRKADGCKVWLVAGFTGTDTTFDAGGGAFWTGLFHPTAITILNNWKSRSLSPRRDNLLGVVEIIDPAAHTIMGWAIDRSLDQVSPYVDVWVDGQYWGGTIANYQRPDIAAAYGVNQAGYIFTIPTQFIDGGCHHADVFAVAPSAEPWNHVVLQPLTSSDFCFE